MSDTDHVSLGTPREPEYTREEMREACLNNYKAALKWVYSELIPLCEHTEDDAALNQIARADTETKQGAFARGRIHEAKGIRRTMAEVIRVKMQEVS